MKNTLLVTFSVLTFVACTPEHSHGKEGGGAGHSHFTKIPATEEEIWKLINEHQAKLEKVVSENNLRDAHDHGYAIRDLVRALPEKMSGDKKAKAEAGAALIVKIATAVDKSSAAKAQKATQSSVDEMKQAVTKLQAELKAK